MRINQIIKFQLLEQNKQTPTDLKSVGANYLFTAKLFLSVGETCGLPRANAVRPYRVLVKDFAISPLNLHTLVAFLFNTTELIKISITASRFLSVFRGRSADGLMKDLNEIARA